MAEDKDTLDDEPGAEASLEELLAKRASVVEDEADDLLRAADREDPAAEPLSVRAVPIQSDEFVCKRCFLVKNSSQLANRKRGLCLDCV